MKLAAILWGVIGLMALREGVLVAMPVGALLSRDRERARAVAVDSGLPAASGERR